MGACTLRPKCFNSTTSSCRRPRRIRSTLDWTPQHDDLETIAAHALAWEEKLFRERHGELRQAVSA